MSLLTIRIGTKQKNLANNKIIWERVEKKKNCKCNIKTSQMILNVLKDIEHGNHPPFPLLDTWI